MVVIRVQDVADPGLEPFTNLTDVQLRRVWEPEHGLFMAEGERVIQRALTAGLTPVSALMEEKWLAGLEAGLAGVPVYLGDETTLRKVTGYRMHRGALAAFRRPTPRPMPDVLQGARTVVVLEDLVDHTNVGLVFRSAAALGVDAVLVTRACADPWYRRSVRTSMGSVFTVPWTVGGGIGDILAELARRDTLTLALSPAGDVRLPDLHPDPPVALLLGTEGQGLSRTALTGCRQQVAIPMVPGADSLNVAAAAAVACYALVQAMGGRGPRGGNR